MKSTTAPGDRAITTANMDRFNGTDVGATIQKKDVTEVPNPRRNRPFGENRQPIRSKPKKYTSFDQTKPVAIPRSRNERVTGPDNKV